MSWSELIGYIILAAAAVFLIRGFWEPTKLECLTVKISLPSAGGSAFRILLFSDLHAEIFRIQPDKLLQAFASASPDLILFAGDLAAHERHLPKALNLMNAIRQLPNLQDIPFFAVRGNHDGESVAVKLQAAGIKLLENTAVACELGGQPWQIIGLADLRTGPHDPAGALLAAEQAGIPPERRLAFAHNPDVLLDLPQGSAAFFLAGHFHGGQIWMPFHLEFLLLRSERLPKAGFYKGHFTWQGTQAYISRGLGCVLLPLRFFSKPELTLLEITPKDDPESDQRPG